MMVSLTLTCPALLLPLAVISICSTLPEVDAFASLAPSCGSCRHATPLRGSSYHGQRTNTKHSSSSLHASPLDIATSSSGIVESSISAFTVGDTFDVTAAFSLDGGVIFGAIVAAVAFAVAQVLLVDATTTSRTNDEGVMKDDANDNAVASSSASFSSASSRRNVRPFRQDVGVVGRRLTTLITGAIGFAASDMILGAAGNLLINVGGGGGTVAATTTTTAAAAKVSASSVYGVQWNALFRRIAAASAKHEAAIASPELLSWIAKSPAAVLANNPELCASIAAQRAFQKGRQVAASLAAAAVVLEEGSMAATATATVTTRTVAARTAAAVVTRQKSGTSDSDNGDDIDDTVTDSFETTSPSSTTAATSTTIFKLKREDHSELSSPMPLSASTCTDFAQSELPMEPSVARTWNDNLEPSSVSLLEIAEQEADDAIIPEDD